MFGFTQATAVAISGPMLRYIRRSFSAAIVIRAAKMAYGGPFCLDRLMALLLQKGVMNRDFLAKALKSAMRQRPVSFRARNDQDQLSAY
ncbi:MAG: hypothetical protein EKK46_04960 [Rhodocyclaceae bacterium]|nr:MAG: hypothetical protein EKK46_04960 [Rhodocyclaceae bacterium]